jgi:simple sugar transport system permease protein
MSAPGRVRSLLDRVAAAMGGASAGQRLLVAAASATLALLIGVGIVAVVHAFTDLETGPLLFAVELLDGAFGSLNAVARTLRFTTVFVLTGVAVAIAFRAGVFNIGVQGQFVVGGFTAVVSILWLAPLLPAGALGGALLIVLGTVAAAIAGGAYAAIPGVLKAYAGANEIITTIMLNFVATGVVGWLVQGQFRGAGQAAPITERLPEYVAFPRLLFDSSSFSVLGLAVAVAVAVVVAVVMSRTRFGYDMMTSGYQEAAATYSGVDAAGTIVATMAFSGIVAGIGGSVFAVMILGFYSDPATIATYGFDAIAVSLLGANNPLGVLPAGLLFGGLDSAGSSIRIGTDVPPVLVDGIIGLVVLFVAAPELFRVLERVTDLGGERE